MGKKAIYLPDDDLWEEVKLRGLKPSQICVAALEAAVAAKPLSVVEAELQAKLKELRKRR